MASSRNREELSTQEQIGALVDEGLLRLLSQVYPLTNPLPDASITEVQRAAGREDVLEYLRECHRQARSL